MIEFSVAIHSYTYSPLIKNNKKLYVIVLDITNKIAILA